MFIHHLVRFQNLQRLFVCKSKIKKIKKIKKAILAIAIAILIGITATVDAQTFTEKEKKSSFKMEMKMKDGVMMSNNKVMLCKGNKSTPLKETYTCDDGCKVSTDGTITKPDGSTMKLMNGYEVRQDGKVTLIPHP